MEQVEKENREQDVLEMRIYPGYPHTWVPITGDNWEKYEQAAKEARKQVAEWKRNNKPETGKKIYINDKLICTIQRTEY